MSADRHEQELLKGLAENDRGAAEQIYRTHFGMVQSMIVNNNGSSDDARDVFQEAMIILYEKSRSGQFELSCQLKTFIYSVTRRLWLKKLTRTQRVLPEMNGVEQTVAVDDELDEHELLNQQHQVMEKALTILGEPCRSLLSAFYLEKKNMAEIAEGFGYTNPENAKNQKYKCLLRLRKLFFSEYKNDVE